jgi:hypothetical protein
MYKHLAYLISVSIKLIFEEVIVLIIDILEIDFDFVFAIDSPFLFNDDFLSLNSGHLQLGLIYSYLWSARSDVYGRKVSLLDGMSLVFAVLVVAALQGVLHFDLAYVVNNSLLLVYLLVFIGYQLLLVAQPARKGKEELDYSHRTHSA